MSLIKRGPFKVPKLTEEHPLYGRLLAREAEKLVSLPDFSKDKGLFILSDFGGEHKGADFTIYSFLICSADKRIAFEEKAKELRVKHGLNDPWKEFGFKDLNYGPISRSLEEFLSFSDNFIHGALITISVDQRIPSLFGLNKREAHDQIVELFRMNDLGEWKGKESEKILRVCHAISVFMSLIAYSGQKILWLCDHDSINADGKKRDFTHTQNIFGRCLAMYSDNLYEIYGFAKPFKKDAGTTDLLSLADFSAGIMQEILQHEVLKKSVELSDEKARLARWMGTKSSLLTKVNLAFIQKDDGGWGVRSVNIQEKI
ncbi:hypothetical protein [Marinomonas pollencensis]|uniref:DUF3800 domain-containing protein n=1 Tax=Marinomonas pollencensis TaxID=491954 RepID=A0A3E0DUQ1_9GAMM|nr:hypothetical protein [Marinomonas pollencensis]REG85852.1 hypothetical protein DFP81_102391 [Marinomonas pollencensis]